MTVIKLELKYCERCGTLRLRRSDSSSTYCQPCTRLMHRFQVVPSAKVTAGSLRQPATAGRAVVPFFLQQPLPIGRLQ